MNSAPSIQTQPSQSFHFSVPPCFSQSLVVSGSLSNQIPHLGQNHSERQTTGNLGSPRMCRERKEEMQKAVLAQFCLSHHAHLYTSARMLSMVATSG